MDVHLLSFLEGWRDDPAQTLPAQHRRANSVPPNRTATSGLFQLFLILFEVKNPHDPTSMDPLGLSRQSQSFNTSSSCLCSHPQFHSPPLSLHMFLHYSVANAVLRHKQTNHICFISYSKV